ncbi:hypothetical protein SAMN04490206_2100 [Pseudomonas umsongensis]|jgi:hypothetical protein|nr:hypothetical protein SAMN04490206_2100 [Pseudomonas umsongensis]
MLAMDVNDDACILDSRGALECLASMLAPTEELNYPFFDRSLLDA